MRLQACPGDPRGGAAPICKTARAYFCEFPFLGVFKRSRSWETSPNWETGSGAPLRVGQQPTRGWPPRICRGMPRPKQWSLSSCSKDAKQSQTIIWKRCGFNTHDTQSVSQQASAPVSFPAVRGNRGRHREAKVVLPFYSFVVLIACVVSSDALSFEDNRPSPVRPLLRLSRPSMGPVGETPQTRRKTLESSFLPVSTSGRLTVPLTAPGVRPWNSSEQRGRDTFGGSQGENEPVHSCRTFLHSDESVFSEVPPHKGQGDGYPTSLPLRIRRPDYKVLSNIEGEDRFSFSAFRNFFRRLVHSLQSPRKREDAVRRRSGILSCPPTASKMRIASLSSSILEQNGLALYALESMFGSAGALGFGGPCGQWKQQGEHSKEEDAGPCNEEPCDTDGRSVAGKCARGKSRDTGHQEKRQQILNRGFFAACGFPAEGTHPFGASLLSFLKPRMMLSGPPVVTQPGEGVAASCQSNSRSRLSLIPRDYAIINIPVEVALHPVVFQTVCSLAETLRRFERTLMLTATTAATALALGIALPKILQNRDGGWNVQAATAVAVLLLPMFVAMRCTYAAAQ
ncbi:putative transmembrane protein [Toxoplasma gondii MAS]|uniref:Putative transmembrane protein n=1 Tax=Toxoplasma gondii MAS TaxID=943118 RepID=A0A086QX85_TOXGO|nr:putative transmembrane protein [Toxoplasma gondii MAS]